MHLTHAYSLAAGQKITKTDILEEYFPLSLEKKYIVIQPFSKPIKNYDYYQDIINLIKINAPEYEIVQVGGDNEPSLQLCVNLQGKLRIRQTAYVIRNAALYFGADSFSSHLAGHYNIPSVVLYSNNYVENVKPYFLDKDKFVSFSPPSLNQPIYSLDVGYKPLNEISPDNIAKEIFRLLGVTSAAVPKYNFIGGFYSNKIAELIPSSVSREPVFTSQVMSVRMDVVFNEPVLAEQASLGRVIIYTDRPINLGLLKQFKNNILEIIYEVKDLSLLSKTWFEQLQKIGINYSTFSYLPEESINTIKLEYYELANIFTKSYLKVNIKDQRYLSGKIVLADGQIYNSIFDYKYRKDLVYNRGKIFNDNICPENEEFLKEVEHFALIS